MAAFSTIAMVGISAYGAISANRQGGQMRRQSAAQAAQALKERKEQQKRVDKEVANYRAMKFTNPYEGMENVFEDLRVSTQAADFQAEQGAQQRANILGQLRGAAGTSGIAGLAQSMANQGQLQARQISAGLSQQEMAIGTARATGAANIQRMERAGDAMIQEAESGRQATILGAQYGQAAGANANYQQAMLNQQNADTQASQMQSAAMQNMLSTAASADWGGGMTQNPQNLGNINNTPIENWGGTTYDSNIDYSNVSDRKLKKNIKKISKSPSGLNIYSFEYKDSKYGKGLFQGVMSDEIPQEAVSNINGYDRVNYNMLDVEFKQI